LLKRMALLARRTDLDRAAFGRHWRTTHAEVVCRGPGIRRYHQNHVVRDLGSVGDLSVDGIVELWFDDELTMQGWAAGATQAGYLLDEPKFMRGVSSFLVEEGAPPRPSPDAVKVMTVRRGAMPGPANLPGLLAQGCDRVRTRTRRNTLTLGLQDADGFETLWVDGTERLAEPDWQARLAGSAAYLIDEVVIV